MINFASAQRAIRYLIIAFTILAPVVSTAATTAPVDFTGVWVGASNLAERNSLWPQDPPYTAEGLAANMVAGSEDDPAFNCVIGFGRIVAAGFPTEIIQQDHQVVIIYEYNHQLRRIYIDGRGHPEKVRPTLMGDSIGRWEGDSLVVETIGAKPLFFRNGGIPYSGDARITERYSLLDDGKTLEILFHIDDPEFYTEPWDAKKYMVLEPDTKFLEYDCTYREHIQP